MAYRAWGYTSLRTCRVALCGYEMEEYQAYVFVVFTVMHLAEVLLFSHPMPVGRVLVFMDSFTPYASTHMGSLRIVEFQVPWITEDHRSVLECWRLVLSAAFVSLKFI